MSSVCSFQECHAVLKYSKANIFILDEKLDMTHNFLTWIEKTSYEEYIKQQANGLGVSVNIPIVDLPVGINLDQNTSKSDYQRLQHYISEGKVSNFSHNEVKHIVSKMVDPEVYRQWGLCMDKMIQCTVDTGYGLHHLVNYRGNEILIKIWYTPYNPTDPWPKFKTNMYVPPVAKCDHDCIYTTVVFDREITVIVNRITSGTGTVIINTDKGAIHVPIVPEIKEIHYHTIGEKIIELIKRKFVAAGVNLQHHSTEVRRNIETIITTKDIVASSQRLSLHIDAVRTYEHRIEVPIRNKPGDEPSEIYIMWLPSAEGHVNRIELDLSDINPASKEFFFKNHLGEISSDIFHANWAIGISGGEISDIIKEVYNN